MEDLMYIAADVSYVLLAIVALLVAKLVKDMATPFRLDEQLTAKDNPAIGLAVTGYFAGVIIIFLGAALGDFGAEELTGASLAASLGIDFLWALAGIVALNVGRLCIDRFVLTEFSTVKEIVDDRNAGTGAVEFGSFIATAMIIAGALYGEGDWLSAIVFFVLGQVALIMFAKFYQWMTKYDIHKEIERDNVAAGVALGLGMIAIGVVLMKSIAGDLTVDAHSLQSFAYYAIGGFVLLLLLRKVTDYVFLPNSTIAHEIANDRNLNAALVEGVVSIGVAAVLFFMI